MPKENYSLQFKKDAVALYEDNVDLSLASAAQDLGVNRSYVVCMGAKAWAKGKRARMDQQQKQAKQISDAQAYPQVRGKKTAGFVKNVTSYGKLLNISRKRQAGDPLPVC